MPQHSSLGDRVRLNLKKKKNYLDTPALASSQQGRGHKINILSLPFIPQQEEGTSSSVQNPKKSVSC